MQLTQPQPDSRSRATIHAGAGLLFVGLVSGVIGGGVWAWLRPPIVAVVSDGAFVIDQVETAKNAQFAGLGWLAIVLLVVGLIVGVAGGGRRGGGQFTWFAWQLVVAALAGAVVSAIGGIVTDWLIAMPEHAERFEDGQRISVFPPVTSSVVLCLAPLVTGIVAWWHLVLQSLDTPEIV